VLKLSVLEKFAQRNPEQQEFLSISNPVDGKNKLTASFSPNMNYCEF